MGLAEIFSTDILCRLRISTLYDQTPKSFKMGKKNHILYAKQCYSVLLLYISIYSVVPVCGMVTSAFPGTDTRNNHQIRIGNAEFLRSSV